MATKEPVPDARDVHSSIYFLERNEIFASVKPYTLAYKPEPGVARENYKREARNLTISDIRACRGDMSLDRNGFIVLDTAELSDTLNWDDKTCVEREYYPAIVAAIEKVLPGASFIPLHHQVCAGSISSFDGKLTFSTLDTEKKSRLSSIHRG